jgi:hypothetical protein
MNATDEAWGRFAATTKYSLRRTLAQAAGSNKAVLTVVAVKFDPATGFPCAPLCMVCSRPLQIGYRVMLPLNRPREYTSGYVHSHPRWCRVALGEAKEESDAGRERA